MKLKKLELFGFKSFADRTEVLFDQGVTCIVGPNGCGKSNISDAIRWVLGERSAKLLRGTKMEDVIFNGTDFRKPLALAEVSLTIDNTDRGLPIDYQEVTLTRKLYRNGDSEYFINKTLCRLKDLHDLILDTGVGSSSYSMFEQGRIDHILNAEPEERRFLVEEAAGISKYKVKKDEAIRKLERTEENLLRLRDIIYEVERNIQYAERQARRAQRYKEQFEKLKDLEIRKAFYDLSRLGTEKNDVEQMSESLKFRAAELESQHDAAKKSLETETQKLREISARFSQEEARRYEVRSKIAQHKQQLGFHQEKRVELANRRGQIQQETQSLQERVEKNISEISAKQSELIRLENENKKAEESIQEAEIVLSSLEENFREIKSYYEQMKASAFEIAAHTGKLRNDHHRAVAFLETSEDRKVKQEASMKRFQAEIDTLKSQKVECVKLLASLQEQLKVLNAEKDRAETELRSLNESLEQEKAELMQTERQLHEKEDRAKMMTEMSSDISGRMEKIFTELTTTHNLLVKRLHDVIRIRTGYEQALESVLNIHARSFVIEHDTSLESLWNFLSGQKSNSMGFLTPFTAKASKDHAIPQHPKILMPMAQIVDIQPGYEPIFESFLNSVYIIDRCSPSEIKNLMNLAPENTFVTQEGWMIGPYGRIFIPSNVPSSEYGFIKNDAEVKNLRQESARLNGNLRTFSNRIKEKQSLAESLKTRLQSMDDERFDLTLRKEAMDSELRATDDRLTACARELDLLVFESQELRIQCDETLRKKVQIEEELAKAEFDSQNLRMEQDKSLTAIEDMEIQKVRAFKTVTEQKTRLESVEERNSLFRESYQIILANDERDRERIKSLAEEWNRLNAVEQQLEIDDKKLQTDVVHLEESASQMDVIIELTRQEKDRIEKTITASQGFFEEIATQYQQCQNELHQSEMKTMNLNYQEKAIAERFQQTYHLHLAELNPELYPLPEGDLEALAKTLEELRHKVETLGTVNLLAIEEYEEMKQRYDFMLTQQQDLEKAREELLEAIRKINRTTKSLFEETFVKVQAAFQDYYQTLFRGGQARLVLVDEANPLESGIDIVVRPPGKKLQHITLLSGGEKALTAIALLFSLFKIKPSPFCVLDEVDAPLDEANIDRFLSVLRTFIESSQFIIVTHNRKTIAMGDSLYGVTMQEAGISKIVSVKVNPDAAGNAPGSNLEAATNQVTA